MASIQILRVLVLRLAGLNLPPLSLLYLSQTAKFKTPDVVLGLGFYLFHEPFLDFLMTKVQ